ncbi:hypothetical protein M0R45_008083 [Rubus argutus]|uniref:F-box domain-containing protein n=1 Tax=Rubus argutus TaxID=59490 RepID=A0AAW1Y1R8_RUBAR
MEKILERVNLRKRIRLSIVCKYWRSIVMQRSGAKHELPWTWKRLRANGFIQRVALSTFDDPSYCTVAAIFRDEKTLGLCKPGDKTWSVFSGIGY